MDILARGHHGIDNLVLEEITIFQAWPNRAIFQMQNVQQLYSHGLIKEVEYRTWLAHTAALIVSPGGGEFWS